MGLENPAGLPSYIKQRVFGDIIKEHKTEAE